ncbi:MAG: phage shock envelope stress response protein PspM, partial [Frankiaceae bacterium]
QARLRGVSDMTSRNGRTDVVRWVGNVLPGLPAHVAYEWEQRAAFRRESRRRAALERRMRRREAAAWVWTAGAAASGVITIGPEHFESIWVLATALLAARAGFAWRSMLRMNRSPVEPAPPMPAPPLRLPWGSMVAEPLHRAESAAATVRQIAGQLPPGPLRDSGDVAWRAAAESATTLRVRASQAASCETAVRRLHDPAHRSEAQKSVEMQVAQLREGAAELESLLVAMSHLAAAAGRDDVAVQLARLRLQEATSSVQELARAMREVGGWDGGSAPAPGAGPIPLSGADGAAPGGGVDRWPGAGVVGGPAG